MFYFEFDIIVFADARVQNNTIASCLAIVVTTKTNILWTNNSTEKIIRRETKGTYRETNQKGAYL